MANNNRVATAFFGFFGLLALAAALCQTIVAALTLKQFHSKSKHDFFDFKIPGLTSKYPLGVGYVIESDHFITDLPAGEVAAGILGLVGAIVALGSIPSLLRKTTKGQHWSTAYGSLFLGAVTLIIGGILIWVFVVATTDKGPIGSSWDITSTGAYEGNIGIDGWSDEITWEAWVCQVGEQLAEHTNSDIHWWRKSCTLSKASRWPLVPLTIFLGAATVALAISGSQRDRAERRRRQDQDKETEMQ